MMRVLASLCFALLMFLGPPPVAHAEEPSATEELSAPRGARPAADQVEPMTARIASQLRCPVCQGLSVADSRSSSAEAMRTRVRELVAAGYSEEQIRDYFVSRYGEWVLLAPPVRTNWVIWLAPGLTAGLGFAWIPAVVARWRKEPEALPSDVGLLPKDKYEERLLAEIDE